MDATLMHIDPLYSIAGALVGLLVGLTGVGGGSLMTPLLVLVFGFHPATAVGTDLLYASATKLAGTGVHGWRRNVDWRIVRRLATGSVPATLITLALLSLAQGRMKELNETISLALGVVLVLTGIGTLFRERLVGRAAALGEQAEPRHVATLTIVLGAVLGALVTLTSVGAGALGMTAMLALYPRVALPRLVGADIAHAVPLTLLAGLGHLTLGSVDGALLVSLLIGSIPGVVAGSLLANVIPGRALAVTIGAVLVILGVKLLV